MRAHRQRGLSLVELMIALTIGLVVLAAAGTIYNASKRSYSRNDGMSRAQENTRGALLLIDTVIRNAGYLPDPIFESDPTAFFKKTQAVNTYAVYGGNASSGLPSFVPSSNPTPLAASDWVMVSYLGCALNATVTATDCPTAVVNGIPPSSRTVQPGIGSNATVNNKGPQSVVTLRSCLGDPVPDLSIGGAGSTQLAVNVFYLGKINPGNAAEVPSLYCATQYYDNGLNPVGSAKTQPLLQGVAAMQALYGLGYSGNRQTSQRVTAGTITAGTGGASWPLVSMVQLNLTTRNGTQLEASSTTQGNMAQGYVQVRTNQAISIRNRLQ